MRTTAQEDMLLVFALVELAQDNKRTKLEAHASTLAAKIAAQHGLTTRDAVTQIDLGPSIGD